MKRKGSAVLDRQFRRVAMEKKKKRTTPLTYIALFICVIAAAGLVFFNQKGGLFSQETLSHPKVHDNRTEQQARKDFDKLSEEIFKEEISDDSITLNFQIKDRGKYGLQSLDATLGEFSLKELKNSLLVSENRVATLETFDYDKLTEEQQLIYDIVYKMSKQNLEAADFLEYAECLGPTTGIQAQLPIFFAEYNLYGKQEVQEYISLLKQVPAYFNNIITFEQNKSKEGIFMSDTTAQAIITQCEDFVENPQNNYLITGFQKRIQSVAGLSEEERTAFAAQNKQAILESVIPAYNNLIGALKKLKGTGKNGGGLCHLKKGKAYYAYLIKTKTGSDRSLDDINTLLDERITSLKKDIADIMSKSPDVYMEAQEVQYPYDTPQKSLEQLKKAIKKDFPALDDKITCQIKTVDASLEESLSPAFYLTPAIDNYQSNVMYINQNKKYDLSKVFTTIGHEGYPGHLYQTCYFLSGNPAPIRGVISVGGYTEGWGTYAELYSYDLADIDKEVAELLKKNTLATLCIYAKADLAVNYLGWDYKKLQGYLADFGFSKTNARTIYDSMVAEPGGYMEYTLGYLEIENLIKEAKKELGDKFVLKDFHKFFLEIGEAPFVIIQDRMEKWIEKKK